jgi:hypothetical protein
MLCGIHLCPGVLGFCISSGLDLPLGFIERRPQRESGHPRCFALARSVRKRMGTARTTGKDIIPVPARAAHAAATAKPIAPGETVWIECERCKAVSVVQLPDGYQAPPTRIIPELFRQTDRIYRRSISDFGKEGGLNRRSPL